MTTMHPRIAARVAALDFAALERLYHLGFAAAVCETNPGSDASPFIMSPAALEARPKRAEAVRSLTLSAVRACQQLDCASGRIQLRQVREAMP